MNCCSHSGISENTSLSVISRDPFLISFGFFVWLADGSSCPFSSALSHSTDARKGFRLVVLLAVMMLVTLFQTSLTKKTSLRTLEPRLERNFSVFHCVRTPSLMKHVFDHWSNHMNICDPRKAFQAISLLATPRRFWSRIYPMT